MKTHIVGGGLAYEQLFFQLGHKLVDNVYDADLLVFTGGEDVSPHLYADSQHRATFINVVRDAKEQRIFDAAVKKKKNMVGICRGGQFLNVMNGGRMYQHVSKHCLDHMMEDARTGQTFVVSSTHHQMMLPAPDALLVATAALHGTREWFDGDVPRNDVSDKDIEVVYYEKSRSLCFQPHPEFSVYGEYVDMHEYFSKLLKEFFK